MFEGKIDNDKIIVSWVTASELNIQDFHIEKSYNKINWETIGFIEGKGTTTGINYYSYIDVAPNNTEIYYRLKQQDYNGASVYSKVIKIILNINPTDFELFQNYPNPFNPNTNINFNLPERSLVELSVYNILGQKVATLKNEILEAGSYSVPFSAIQFPSGVYFYTIRAGDFVSTKKMLLLK